MGEEADKKTPELAIAQAGGVAVEEAIAMARAAEMLDVPIETLVEGVYTPLYSVVRDKRAIWLKRMAAVCLLLYSEKSEEERDGEVNNAD